MPNRTTTRGPATARPYSVRPANARAPMAVRVLLGQPTLTPAPVDPLGRDPKLSRVEAALMLADEPLLARRIAEAAELQDAGEARKLVHRLRDLYDADETPFQVVELAGGFQLLTRANYHPWLVRLRRTGHDVRLTSAGMETLAVIAYKQPIMRAEIEKIRGVNCTELIRLLMEKGMVRIAGRHDSLGRPQLYGTTKQFLQAFGLNTLKDLPEVESLKAPG
ncbi:SMC-Scp complex subunit ScpB [Limnoglobus roseus]|uniref:SMC-Scp complex subunit ScpB n=1 Tax=Limnoglobus roseus TaxID=2598579 RepID=A0A5C1A5X7_9BACT|nr:SMC-Scp complex subunit ScpB [Limnoglobus roseus]QEL14589.1 SMC-Scp complex subunit ScpB [Limnoglobus roseus]